VSDLLTDAKVPRLLRDSVPILTGGGAILWVVGHRLSHAARVTGRTRQVIHIQVKRQS
jgi:tRNA(Ile)-lysidine synthase